MFKLRQARQCSSNRAATTEVRPLELSAKAICRGWGLQLGRKRKSVTLKRNAVEQMKSNRDLPAAKFSAGQLLPEKNPKENSTLCSRYTPTRRLAFAPRINRPIGYYGPIWVRQVKTNKEEQVRSNGPWRERNCAVRGEAGAVTRRTQPMCRLSRRNPRLPVQSLNGDDLSACDEWLYKATKLPKP
jgi:hypothetical protein